MSHAHAQLRLARTHERIEIEIEINFPVRGVGQAGLVPPNLRYSFYNGVLGVPQSAEVFSLEHVRSQPPTFGGPPYYTPPQQMEILEAWNAGVYGCWGIWMLVYMALWHGWQDLDRSQQRRGAAAPLLLSMGTLPTMPQSHVHQHPYTPASIYPSIPSL